MPAFGGAGSFLARDVTVSPPGHVAKLSTPFDHIWPRPDHMRRDTVRHGLWVYMAVRDIIFKCTEKCLLCSQHLTVYTYLWFKIDVEAIMKIETASCKSGLKLVLNAEEKKVAYYGIVQADDQSFPIDENTTEEQTTLIWKSQLAAKTELVGRNVEEMILAAFPDAEFDSETFDGLTSWEDYDEDYKLYIRYEEAGFEHWDLFLNVDGQRYSVDLDKLGIWGQANLVAV